MSEDPVTKFVVVDDAHPLVQYTGDWRSDPVNISLIDELGTNGHLYNHTLQWTTTNASLSFSFSGPWVQLYGGKNTNEPPSERAPSWECRVDGEIFPALEDPFNGEWQNNWLLCDLGLLPDGPHTITVNVTSRGEPFAVDYLRYIPTPNLAFDTPPTLFVHPYVSEVMYGPSWTRLGNEPVRFTDKTGETLDFAFIGTSVAWYAIIPIGFPTSRSRATYSIDGSPPTPFYFQGFPRMTSSRHNELLFESAQLPYGKHNLSVVFYGNAVTTPLSLQYFVIENGSLNGTLSQYWTPEASTAPSNPGGAEPSFTKAQLIGIIAGASVAGLIIFLLVGYIIYLRRSRFAIRKEAAANIMESKPLVSPTTPGFIIEPFAGAYPPATPTTTGSPDMQFSSSSSKPSFSPNRRGTALVTEETLELPQGSQSSARTPQSRENTFSMSPTSGSEIGSGGVLYYHDSGVRLPRDNLDRDYSGKERLPPVYTPD
ncbi:hypothetical protein FA15DRAFT_418258 [Coprinopsis marcescibilis]|uniref:Transmembrane protein n=1 Tax=Coprinopsis marcescibilis TaxID=230819 RepID=A0A5C3KUS9_COPMA|nr:hypothetical protein FA15DRAFT_418258 [Coprinopsis marcescibilis]